MPQGCALAGGQADGRACRRAHVAGAALLQPPSTPQGTAAPLDSAFTPYHYHSLIPRPQASWLLLEPTLGQSSAEHRRGAFHAVLPGAFS